MPDFDLDSALAGELPEFPTEMFADYLLTVRSSATIENYEMVTSRDAESGNVYALARAHDILGCPPFQWEKLAVYLDEENSWLCLAL